MTIKRAFVLCRGQGTNAFLYLVSEDPVIPVSARYCVLTTESVKAAAEDAFIEEFVLAEEIQRAVGDRCSRKNEVVLTVLAESVKGFVAFGFFRYADRPRCSRLCVEGDKAEKRGWSG